MLGVCVCVSVWVNSWYKACVSEHTGTAGWIFTPPAKAPWETVVHRRSEPFNSSGFSALGQLFPVFVSSLWFPPPAAWEPTWALSRNVSYSLESCATPALSTSQRYGKITRIKHVNKWRQLLYLETAHMNKNKLHVKKKITCVNKNKWILFFKSHVKIN